MNRVCSGIEYITFGTVDVGDLDAIELAEARVRVVFFVGRWDHRRG